MRDDSHDVTDPAAPMEFLIATEKSIREGLIDAEDGRRLTGSPPPAVRGQADGRGDEYSLSTAIDFTGVRVAHPVRQEFADEQDIEKMLQRHGAGIMQRQPEYQQVDFDIDLQHAITAVNQMREAHAGLPPGVKERYPTWQSMVEAAENGTLNLDPPKPAEPAAPAAAPAAPTEPQK